jgi:uncharacterized membrane protein YraQ (UPF0718 family)
VPLDKFGKVTVDASVIQDFVINFIAVVWQAMPFILLGALIAGILEELLPQDAITRFLPKHFIPAVLIGGALGLIFPMCECGIVVVMRRLLRKGLPLSCCVAYMLAGPIVNVVVLMSTWYAFKEYQVGPEGDSLGPPMVLLRAGLGYVVACLTGFAIHFVEKRSKTPLLTVSAMPPAPKKPKLSLTVVEVAPPPTPKKSLAVRLNNITAVALHDFMDITVFLILGSALAALMRTNSDWVASFESMSRSQPIVAIPAMMALAVLLCLCSEADAFLAASFTKASVSAKLSFLVLGPMLDLKLLLMYTRVFRWKLIAAIVPCVVIQCFIYCMIVHQFYNPLPTITAAVPGK